MAIYRTGQASMDAQGYITGYGTKWREQLTLIRPGATIFFLTNPMQAAVITEVISDTSIRAITTGGAVVAKTNYLIMLHDSITVDGLAQDVAETLRYYQGKETELSRFIEIIETFDWDKLQQIQADVKSNADAAAASQNAAKTSENNAKTSATNAENSKKGADTAKTAAESARDAANTAKTGAETARKGAETARDAANTAKTGAEDARDKAEEYAKQAAEPYKDVLQPLPDVWIPFNDSLEMITGFAPGYKKITVGNDVITMPTDKVVTFSRASTATYINKSGVLTVAEIDEPRFEKEGLLIEGQRTNYFINSNTPELWNPNPGLSRSETKTDNRGFKYATFTPGDYIGQTGAYTIIAGLTANKIPVVSGDHVAISFRAKGVNLRIGARFDKGDPLTASAIAFIDLDNMGISTSGSDANNIIVKNVSKDGDWIVVEVVYEITDTSTDVRGVINMANKTGGAIFDDTSTVDISMPQIEVGPCASSFIIAEGTPATRASDLVSIPTRNNLYKPPFTFLLEVHKKWDIAPNAAPRVWDIAAANTGQAAIAAINRGSGKLYMSLSNPSGSYVNIEASDVFAKKTTFGCIAKADGNFHVVTNAIAVSDAYCDYIGVTGDKNIRFGGQTGTGERHLFGHIRNFRIWHKALTDHQLGEIV